MNYRGLVFQLTLLSALTFLVFLAQGGYGAQLPLSVQPAPNAFPDLYEASIAELQAGLEQEQFTSVDLVTVSHAFIRAPATAVSTNLSAIGVPREDRRSEPSRTSAACSH